MGLASQMLYQQHPELDPMNAGPFMDVANLAASGWGNQITPFDSGLMPASLTALAMKQGESVLAARNRERLAAQQQALDWDKARLAYETAGNALDWQKEKFPQEQALKREEIGAKRDIAGQKAGFDWTKLGIQEQGKDRRASIKNETMQDKIAQMQMHQQLIDQMKQVQSLGHPTFPEIQDLAGRIKQANPGMNPMAAMNEAHRQWYMMRRQSQQAAIGQPTQEGDTTIPTPPPSPKAPSFLSRLFSGDVARDSFNAVPEDQRFPQGLTPGPAAQSDFWQRLMTDRPLVDDYLPQR